MSETMIEVQDLTKHYGAVKALQGVSFEVPRGQVVGLLGPNGAGKTTAMRILTGFVAPTEGSAKVDGLDVVEDAPACRRHIGYLPEGNPLYTDLRVDEALAFSARLHRIGGHDRKQAIAKSLEAAGLAGYQRRIIGQLSKGLKQRVGLAQALMHEPAILILDEPTSGLDPNQQEDMRHLIRDLGSERTVILSTHILSEVEAVCDRALIVNEGRLVADGSVAEIKREQAGGAVVRAVVRGSEDRIRAVLGEAHDLQAIGALPGAEDVYEIRVGLEDPGEFEPLERIAAALIEGGLGLSHLSAEGASLEQVFARLTIERQASDDLLPSPLVSTPDAPPAATREEGN